MPMFSVIYSLVKKDNYQKSRKYFWASILNGISSQCMGVKLKNFWISKGSRLMVSYGHISCDFFFNSFFVTGLIALLVIFV